MFWIIIIICIIGFFILIGSGKNTGANKQYSVEVDVPNPTIASPLKVLTFINECDPKIISGVWYQLHTLGTLKSIVYLKAFEDKQENGSIDIEYYLKIFDKIQRGNYSIDLNLIPENYNFILTFDLAGAFIPGRKEHIIFKCEEGETVQLLPEPDNIYDKHAIRINHKKNHIGYVPRIYTSEIGEILKFENKIIISDIVYGTDDRIDVFLSIYASDKVTTDKRFRYTSYQIEELRSRKVDSLYLRPKKDAQDVDLFYKKKVVITGLFDDFPDRNDIARLLYESGADVDTAITERINYVIVGKDAGWKKLERIEELGIMTLSEDEFKKIYSFK